jgi:hypothetical protein
MEDKNSFSKLENLFGSGRALWLSWFMLLYVGYAFRFSLRRLVTLRHSFTQCLNQPDL